MTPKQKAAIKHNIKLKWLHGEITTNEYDSLVNQLDSLAASGASLQDANNALGLYKKPAKPALKQAAAAQSPMTKEEAKALKEELKKQYMSGILSLDEWDSKAFAISEALKAGVTLAEAKQAAGISVASSVGMTHEEYIGLWESLKKKLAAGLLTHDEYLVIGGKLDKHYQQKTPYLDTQKDIGIDPGSDATSEAIIKLSKRLNGVYKQAQKELKDKLKGLTADYQKQYAKKQQELQAGLITQADLDKWKAGWALHLGKYKAQIDQCAGVMLNANQKAMAMINGETFSVFGENANWQGYKLVHETGVNLSFAIYDERTVEMLIKDRPELLPRKEVDGKKDVAWNRAKIANAVAVEIIKGGTLQDLAKRIAADTGEANGKAMMRYARTAMTCAQNGGRMESLRRAVGMGIKARKLWIATLDNRTRDAHADLDGQAVPVDEPFKSQFGDIMFPGDRGSEGSVPANLYNCRCSLGEVYDDYPADPSTDMRRDNETGEVIQNMDYKEWKAAKQGSKLNDLNTAKVQLAEAQKEYIKHQINENKVYEGIWKDPVTLADYPAKEASVQAKKDYYAAEIAKIKQAQADGYSWATPEKVKELEKKRALLNEFVRNAKIVEKRKKALKAVQDIYDQINLQKTATAPKVAKAAKTSNKAAVSNANAAKAAAAAAAPPTPAKKGQFAPEAWDAKTKSAAPFYSSRYDADKLLRPELDAMWDTLTDHEKYSVWEYTNNSNPINKSLSGYHDTFARTQFVGYEHAIWGYEDSWRRLPDYWKKFGTDGHSNFHSAITSLTKAIEKSELHHAIWFKRQSTEGGFAGIFEGAGMNFETAMKLIQTDPEKLVGLRAKNHAFTSCGMAKDARWSGNVYYKIYCPEGTKGLYSEPQSVYGHTSPQQIYKPGKKYSTIGTEAEVVLQRGTEYRITGIKKKGSDYEVEMEVVAQPDYFTYGDEDTYNDGKTRHKR